MNIKLEELKKLIATLEEGRVSEFEYEDETSRIRLAFGHIGQAPQVVSMAAPALTGSAGPAPAIAAAAVEEVNVGFVTSPFVGTFYRSPSPDAASFTEVGQSVKPGQVLCIVEAMKLMNEIESEIGGTVLEVLVSNGTSVEFGQKLFKIKKG